jgi:hypothetical protein
MPRPHRFNSAGRSIDGELIRADKDRFVRQLYRRLGPAEFWRRRLVWLAVNGKRTSFFRLVAYLQREGIDISIRPNARGAGVQNPGPDGSP